MKLEKITPVVEGLVNVIIETPKGSKHKLAYEEEMDVVLVKKTLPVGAVFPFDFGFVPNTLAEDGDPIDVLVIMDEPAPPGCLVACRLLGVLEATQRERDGETMRNDRIVAVANVSVLYEGIHAIDDLNKNMEDQIAEFFINYNRQAGKEFKPLQWADAETAMQLIEAGTKS